MGKLLRFRRKPRWRRSAPKPARFRTKTRPKSWGQALAEVRPILLFIALATLAVLHQTPGFYEPPAFLQSDPREVSGDFTRCGNPGGDWGRGAFCVIDGDTFKLGDERFRVSGIDTAERDARCPAEAAQAEASTAALQRWLNRGPFRIATRLDEPTDRYGRTLVIVKRTGADGGEDRLADFMRDEGGARRYDGGLRGGWC